MDRHSLTAEGSQVRLTLRLLGGFEARLHAGSALTLPTKAQALLAYLAIPLGRVHPREKLASLLWSDMRDEHARQSLRQALYDLRKALGAGATTVLLAEGESIALNPEAVDVDVATLTRLVAQRTPDALQQAALLYQGDLLAGLNANAEEFERWLLDERERLRELALEGLAKLLAQQHANGALEPAVQTALRLLALDPLQEVVHRRLMQLYAALGRRGAALRQYQQCVNALQQELGVDPETKTKELYQKIMRDRKAASAIVAAARDTTAAAKTPAARAHETPFIGRVAELASLRDALQQASLGRGRIVAVTGDGGIGKTRMVEELIAAAVAADCGLLLGRAYESDRVLLFGPLVDALRGAGIARESELFEALDPLRRLELVRLLPEIGPAESRPAEAVDFRRLFESVVQLVVGIAHRQPLLLVLEDIHWADEMTIRFLAFLARRMTAERVLVLITARVEEIEEASLLRHVMEDLAQAGQLVFVRLAPLVRSDAMALMRRYVRASHADDMERIGEEVWRASEGNPFVIVEMMRALQQGATPRAAALPQRVREVTRRRLEHLSESGRALLNVSAAIGREFDFELLRRAAGLEADPAAAGVEELVRRRILTVVGERLDFTHDRIRELAYEEATPWRRKHLHRDIAAAIESLYADRLHDFWEALASHYERGEMWLLAARYHLRVAERAKQGYALATAERSCRRALEVAAKAQDTGAERAAALALLGDVLSRMGEIDRANENYDAALAVAPTEAERFRIANKRHRTRFATRDGARLAFYDHGSGAETLLLMNPIVYGLEIFQPLIERLCQEFRMITMDARGTGHSDPISAHHGCADHADDVAAVIAAAGCAPVNAIGFSKSGNYLVRLAATTPGLIKKLIVLGTPVDVQPGCEFLVPSPTDDQFRAAWRAGDIEKAIPFFVATIVSDPDTGDLADQFTRTLLRMPRETLLNNWAPDPHINIASILDRVHVPTLVLHGTLDRRVSLASAHYLVEHIPNARLHLFEGRGHLPIFTASDEFCDVLRRFLATPHSESA